MSKADMGWSARRDGREPDPEHGEQGLPGGRVQPHHLQGRRLRERPREGQNIVGVHSIAELVGALERPRKIMIMVKAGKASTTSSPGGPLLERATS